MTCYFFSLNLDFDLFVSTRKYVSPDFWRKLFKMFSFDIYSLFSNSAFLRIFSVSREGPGLGGRTQRRRYGGSNLAANYNSANKTQKKGVY